MIELKKMPLVYVAGPYRSKTEHGVRKNIQAASDVALTLWQDGFAAICPHKNTEGWGGAGGMPDSVWLDGDLVMLSRCDAIVMLDSYTESQGAVVEHRYAIDAGIPVFYQIKRMASMVILDSRGTPINKHFKML